jgi:predicted secreted protein
MALAGSGMVISASVNGSAWTAIDELNNATMACNGENIDITKFADTYRGRIQGIKDASYSLSGFYDSGDTNGQVAIRAAWAGNTAIYIKFTIDGTNGWSQQCKVSGFNINAAVDGAVEVTIDLEGTGTITTVP